MTINYTDNIGLKKPDDNEFFDVEHMNFNSDAIDEKVNENSVAATEIEDTIDGITASVTILTDTVDELTTSVTDHIEDTDIHLNTTEIELLSNIDDEPTENSDHLVTSGGVYSKLNEIETDNTSLPMTIGTRATTDTPAANSATIGQNLTAYANNIIVGVNNNPTTTTAIEDLDSNTDTGTVFAVGNGTSTTGANALRIAKNGQVYTNSTIATTGADFAEYYEWSDQNSNNEDRVGLFVSLDGEYIKLSQESDDILGVVSAVPAYVADGQDEEWTGMYQKDVFGRKIVQNNKWLLNPEYDQSVAYVSREYRNEWSVVATLGKVVVIDDGTAEANDYITSSNNGIATKSDVKTRFKVMKRLDNTHLKIVLL